MIFRTILVGCLTLCATTFQLSPTNADESPSAQQAIALLRGVEAARLNVKSGRANISVVKRERDGDRQVERLQLQVQFSGSKRRFLHSERIVMIDGSGGDGDQKLNKYKAMGSNPKKFVKAGLGEFKDVQNRTVFDGTQLMKYGKDFGATIENIAAGTADLNFDPRILGISVWLDVDYTVPKVLAYANAASIELKGQEIVNGHSTWKVAVVVKDLGTYSFWIEDIETFPVHRVEYVTKYQRRRTTAEYDKNSKIWPLPKHVLIEEFKLANPDKVVYDISCTISDAELNIPIESSVFGFAGLEMPIGEEVVDVRIHRRIGYWNGTRVSAQRAAKVPARLKLKPVETAEFVEGGSLFWAVVSINVLIITIGCVVFFRNRAKRPNAQ